MSAVQITPFRVTADDLPDLDAKVRAGIENLLDALNITLPQLVQAAQLAPEDNVVELNFVTGATVAGSFPLTFKHGLSAAPRFVSMVCVPKDPNHSLATPFVMQGFSITDAGLVSVPFITGLLVDQSYRLSFYVR